MENAKIENSNETFRVIFKHEMMEINPQIGNSNMIVGVRSRANIQQTILRCVAAHSLHYSCQRPTTTQAASDE